MLVKSVLPARPPAIICWWCKDSQSHTSVMSCRRKSTTQWHRIAITALVGLLLDMLMQPFVFSRPELPTASHLHPESLQRLPITHF